MPDSKRSSRGFQQIPDEKTPKMPNPKDATIDIPLSTVQTQTGARRSAKFDQQALNSQQGMNEKTGYNKRPVAGRRVTQEAKTARKRKDKEEPSVTRMGHIYDKILKFSIVTRYILYILPLAIILAIPIIIGATVPTGTTPKDAPAKDGGKVPTVPTYATLGGVRIVWIFAWLECVWLSLWVSKLTAKTLPWVFQFLCGIVSSGTRKYALVIKALEIYLSLCGWALASLATFIPIMTRNPTQRAGNKGKPDTGRKPWETVVNGILAALLIASLILLAEKLLIQLISIGYHRTQFDAKIKDSKHKIHLLSLLYDASRSLFPAYCNEFAEEDYIINDSIDLSLLDGKRKEGHRRSGSATPMRLIQNIGRAGDKLTSAFGNIAHEVTGKQVFNPDSAHSIVVEALEKNKSSEALAKRLWMSFVVEGKEALYQEDIVEVLGVDRHEDAEEAFAILDRDGNGDISLDEMILTVCEFGKERHSIANSLHDVDQAINVLDNLLCTIIFIMVIFVFVAFLNSSFTTTLATAGTALLSLSFVFAATAQEVLGSCIFLFVKHPFDVLDRVDIGEEQYIVKHISLMFTVFKNVKTHKQTQVANIVLNTLWIHNVTRSEAMREQLLIYVDFATTLEDVQLLRNKMQAFVSDKENSRDFQHDIEVEVTGIAEMNKMELKVEIRHKSNWSNETVRAARRSKFMCALVLALRKIPVNAPGGASAALGSVDQPSYTVAISDVQAASNRDAYTKSKDEKRLFPTEKSSKPEPPTKDQTRGVTSGVEALDHRDSASPPPLRYRQPAASESTALSTLNSRHPAADTANSGNDLIEPTTPKSLTHSISAIETPPDFDRSVSIEEVRGMLRRQSTRGKRRISAGSSKHLPLSDSINKLPPPPATPATNTDYESYHYSSAASSTSTPKDTSYFPQPPTSVPRKAPTSSSQLPEMSQRQIQTQTQQRPPPPSQSQQPPRQAPPIAPPPAPTSNPQPPPKPLLSTQNIAAADESSRATSPVRNPFQIKALGSQAQGVGVPAAVQARRPVPGSGNTFSPSAEGAVRPPPRGDSLPVPPEDRNH